MSIKCSPHNWITPKPGDTDLICPNCGRALSLLDIRGSDYVFKAVFKSLARLERLVWCPDDLDAFKGFLGQGPRVSEFHPNGIEQSLSLAREREKTSNYNKVEKYRKLKVQYHTAGYYDSGEDDCNATLLPIVWTPSGESLSIEPSLAFNLLSPFFDWGYDGDSPLQLALAILYDHTKNKRRSLEYYEDFKDYYVARWNNTGWGITPAELDSWLEDRKMRWK